MSRKAAMLPAERWSASLPAPIPANSWNPIIPILSSTICGSCFPSSKRHKSFHMSSSPATPPNLAAAALPADGRLTLKARLQRSPAWVFILYVSLTSFVVYACMYGFRKPFTAASYSGITFFHISYKVVLVIAQVLGYMLSKFYGIRFIAGMRPERRAGYIVLLIFVAWASLLLFAFVPAPYNFIFMFINGLPLGMVW